MSLKLSLDLLSNTDWSIQKNQIVVHEIIHRTAFCHLLLSLCFPSRGVAGCALIFIKAWREKSQTFLLEFSGKYCEPQNRCFQQVNQNV